MYNTTKIIFAISILSFNLIACSKRNTDLKADSKATTAQVARTISIDGSSTVFPISEAMAEEFQKLNTTTTKVTVATSGTGGGFKKLCAKEIAIAGASRPIKPSEVKSCQGNKVEYIELPIAYDGIVVVVNPKNNWINSITVDELKKLWSPEAQNTVKTWADVRKGFPTDNINLFGAGVDSGTYDYFTKAIVGEEHKSRGDYTSSEDDNVLVHGIATDKFALGFFGFGYYYSNKDKLKALSIGTENPVAPSYQTIENGTYQPLSRPIFIYVRKDEAERKEVQDFIHYYLGVGTNLINEVGYVKLPERHYVSALKRFNDRVTGTQFSGQGSKVGVKL